MIYAEVSWIKVALGLNTPNWTIQTGVVNENDSFILGEEGSPLILEGPQVGGTPGTPGVIPPATPTQKGELDFSKTNNSAWIQEGNI